MRPRAINLLETAEENESRPLELIRVDGSDTAVTPFTPDGVQMAAHYVDEPELHGYVPCNRIDPPDVNNPPCMLCQAGKKREERVLLPVYQPLAKKIGVLSMSYAKHPHALLPQLQGVLTAKKPTAVFIRREREKYFLRTAAVTEQMDAGEHVIAAFEQAKATGQVDLACVYPPRTNDELRQIPGIAQMLALKGF